MGTVFAIYNLAAVTAVRRFVATYRKHLVMLGIFIFMVLFSLGFIIQMALAASSVEEQETGLGGALTPGSIALVAFVLLFARGLVDAQKSIIQDRALWSTLVSPVKEGTVRTGLLLRSLVFQMGLLAAVMAVVTVAMLPLAEKPYIPQETGPLIVLAALVGSILPLPFLLSAMTWRQRGHRSSLVALIVLETAFVTALALEAAVLWIAVTSISLVAACAVITSVGPPALTQSWASYEGQRYRPAGGDRRLPPMFRFLMPRRNPVARALFRREMSFGYPSRQRMTFVALNLAVVAGLLVVHAQLRGLMVDEGFEDYFRALVTPLMVGLGIYALAFFQATMPLLEGVTREGLAIWVLKSSPVEPWRFVHAKVRPLLGFLPLTAVSAGLALPFVNGSSWQGIAMATLGAVAVFLTFLGVGAWAGATYPNLDRHSNAPPDMVLAFYLMFGCLFLMGLMLLPVVAIGSILPEVGIMLALFMVLIGWLLMWAGIRAGGRALRRLEVG